MPIRAIVLDANVLMRAVLGSRVPQLLIEHSTRARFLAPATAFDEAREHLPRVLHRRGLSRPAIDAALAKLDALGGVVMSVPADFYQAFKERAAARIGARDPDDWPVLACALAADCPVWTEDTDFFGTGVATWTTASIEIYLNEPVAAHD